MMKLSQVFDQLTSGEMSQVFLGGREVGGVREQDYHQVGNHVLLGLTALYKRFNLKQNQLVIKLEPGKYVYPLLQKYAVNDKYSKIPVVNRHIVDSMSDLFKGDVIKVAKVDTEDGCTLALGQEWDKYSITLNQMDSIRVPKAIVDGSSDLPDYLKTDTLTVYYQANHPNYVPLAGFYDPELTQIELPDTHLQALLYYVASRVHNPVGMSAEFNAGNNWFSRYELECKALENSGNYVDNASQHDRVRRNGWA